MNRPCAITGIGAVTALGASAADTWSAMMAGACGIRPMRRFPAGEFMTDFAAEVPADVEEAIARGVGRHGGAEGERARLFALSAARQALGGPGSTTVGRGVGLILATTKGEMDSFQYLANAGRGAAARGKWNPYDLARAVADELGLGGPVMAVSNACASGLAALMQAARMIRRADADEILVVGVDVLSEFVLAGFSSLAAMSGRPCRPYDVGRDGLSLGEGAGAVLISAGGASERRESGRILGWGITNDATHITAPSRTGEGLSRAIRSALAMAGLRPGDVDYINGHGTATVYNDAMEARAISGLFGRECPPMTSMKGYFGHTLGAAGMIELALSVMAMERGVVPGCMGMERCDGPINVPSKHAACDDMRSVLSIKCGFGGVNAAVVVGAAGGHAA